MWFIEYYVNKLLAWAYAKFDEFEAKSTAATIDQEWEGWHFK